jgi:YHS domain-containing protein
MIRLKCLLCWMLPMALAAAAGCNSPAELDRAKAPAASHSPAAAAPAPAAQSADQEEIKQNMAQLSPEDRAAAEKQKICPVSDEPLGGMGKPYKASVKGRTVFLCCAGCEEALKQDPDKYLKKLDAGAAK